MTSPKLQRVRGKAGSKVQLPTFLHQVVQVGASSWVNRSC